MGSGGEDDGSGVLDTPTKSVIFGTGGAVLLVLLLFIVTLCLLWKIWRRLRWLQPPDRERLIPKLVENGVEIAAAEHSEDPHSDHHTATEDSRLEDSHSDDRTQLSKKESSESTSPEVDPAIEAMYAVIPKEHREQKKKRNQICIQQYDDIDLLPLESQDMPESDGSHHHQASVTVEGSTTTGYSRLCHVGPRMNQLQTKKHTQHNSGGELVVHDVGKRRSMSLCTTNVNSENSSSTRPTSKLIVPNIMGKHSLIEIAAPHNVDDSAPPLPKRLSVCLPSPVENPQNKPNVCDTTSEKVKSSAIPIPYQGAPTLGTLEPKDDEHTYSVVKELKPNMAEKDFVDECLSELQNGEQLYDVVK